MGPSLAPDGALRRAGLRQEGGLCELEHGYRVLAGDGREVDEELVEGITGFEILNERLHGHAHAGEDRCAAEAIRMT